MTIQITLPAKRRIDVRPFKVDFSQWLGSGESVTAAQLSVSLFTGTDPDPAAILYLDPEILNNVVTQRIREGIPGNIYTITMEVTTNLGNELTAETVQAVLPDGVPAEDIYIPFFLTTTPYPLNVVESIESGIEVVDGFTLTPDIVGINFSLGLSSGTLRALLQKYENALPEGIDHSFTFLSGTLRDILVEYTDALPEGIDSSFAILSGGTLRIIIVFYTNWPAEGIESGLGLLSGTLA